MTHLNRIDRVDCIGNKKIHCKIHCKCLNRSQASTCKLSFAWVVTVFRCYEAPLKESLAVHRSVRPSVHLSVTPSDLPTYRCFGAPYAAFPALLHFS